MKRLISPVNLRRNWSGLTRYRLSTTGMSLELLGFLRFLVFLRVEGSFFTVLITDVSPPPLTRDMISPLLSVDRFLDDFPFFEDFVLVSSEERKN